MFGKIFIITLLILAGMSLVAPAAVSTKNIQTLDAALKTGLPVIVKMGSDSCYYCKKMAPILKELAADMDGKAVILDLDIYKNRELAKQMSVRVIPTILYYDKKGKLKEKYEGFQNREQLLKAIEKLNK